jgi:uncharacterized NAD(P)/FAD-binding protein YdhS
MLPTNAMPHFTGSPHARLESVAIIGGGFSGAILAAQLLRKSAGRLSVALIEPNPCLGRGVAYGTKCPGHLLNVPAKDMSAFPDDPEHFLRWARCHHDPGVKDADFLPRCRYGDYLHFVLHDEIGRFPGSFEHVEDEAVALGHQQEAVHVRLRSGTTRIASKVILALGNFPPAELPLPESGGFSRRYVRDPWAPGALSHVAPADDVLLVGCGLTSVDVLIALRGSGSTGKIHFLSRHGLRPNAHSTTAPWPLFATEASSVTLRELMSKVRMQVIVARMRGYDWRAVIDAMRPATRHLWRSLPAREQCRFLRHLRPYWEVHRHRIAPEIAARLEAEITLGHANIHAGRMTACEEKDGAFDVRWRDRHAGRSREMRVQHIVNCTGPQTDCRRIDHPLLANLLRAGLARPDKLSLGLDCGADGALIDDRGTESKAFYALGPLRKGGLWESTAVPEIRIQASDLAEILVVGHARVKVASAQTNPASNHLRETLHSAACS